MNNMPLLVQYAMTIDEKAAFLKRFVDQNPNWNGAHVADILDNLNNTDANLTAVEFMYAAHEKDVPEKDLLRTATNACIGAYGWTYSPLWNKIVDLVTRVRIVMMTAGANQ